MAAPRPTALGALLAGLAATTFALSLALGTIGPAIIGLILLALLDGARRETIAVPVRARRVVPERAHLGDPFTVTVQARSPSNVPLAIDERAPKNCHTENETTTFGRGQARTEQVLTPRQPGLITWKTTTIRLSDPWHLWTTTRPIPLDTELPVRPEPVWHATGRRIGKRRSSRSRRLARFEPEPDPSIRRIRRYQPGDRARDIDWKRTSRSERIHVRERERIAQRPLYILVDATRPMRLLRHHSKLTTMMRLVHATAGLGAAAGRPTHIVVYHDQGTTALHARHAHDLSSALERLTRLPLPEPDPAPPRTPHGPQAHPKVDPDERRFLVATKQHAEGKHRHEPADQSAMLQLSGRDATAGTVIAFLDAEQDPAGTRAKTKRLRRHGHDVLVVAPATGSHGYTRDQATGTILQRLREHRYARQDTERHLYRERTPLVTAHPGHEDDVLEEVARWIH